MELPLSGEGQLVNVQVKEFEDPLLAYFVKIRDGMPRIAEVSWAFAISKIGTNLIFSDIVDEIRRSTFYAVFATLR